MKIKGWTDGPVELEADISIDDVLAELAEQVEHEGINRLITAIDWLTRILANVSDADIAKIKSVPRAEIQNRLLSQARRYEAPSCPSRLRG